MSQSRTNTKCLYLLAFLYAITNALSGGSSMAYAWNAETEDPYLAGVAGVIFGAALGISGYFLQGRAMIEEIQEGEEESHSPKPAHKTAEETPKDKKESSSPKSNHRSADDKKPIAPEEKTPLKKPEAPTANYKTDLEAQISAEDMKSPDAKSPCASYALQSAFVATQAMNEGADRYFLLHSTWSLFSTVNPIPFWLILFLTTIIANQPFALASEVKQTCEAISKSWDGKAEAFYGSMFRPISSPTWRKAIRILGSIDHTTAEMLSLSAYLTRDMINYLRRPENETILNLVLGIGSIVGLYCATWVFIQTFYFEGKYAEKFLKTIYDKLVLAPTPEDQVKVLDQAFQASDHRESKLSNGCIRFFATNITVIGTLKHGESAAAPIFNVGRSIANNVPNYYPELMGGTIALTALTGIVNMLVTYLAEIKPTIRKFSRSQIMIQELADPPIPTAPSRVQPS